MPAVTISGVFPSAFQSTQNIVITSAGGFGSSPPVGATATFTETGGNSEVATSTTFPSWSDTQVVVTCPTFLHADDVGVTWTVGLTGTGLTTTLFTVAPFVSTQLISSITPNPQTNGQNLVINGSGFGASQDSHFEVHVDNGSEGELLTVTSWSDTQIHVNAPTTFKYGFPPGYPDVVGIWNNHFPLFNTLLTNAYVIGLGAPSITSYVPSPTVVAQNQTLTIVGTGFNPTQDGTTVSFSTAGGIPVTPAITSWSEDNSGIDTIKIQVPGTADIGSCHVTFTNSPYSVTTISFTVEAPLALPGGTTATVNQPVHITGSGFGVTQGTLIYFSAAGLTYIVPVTDWSDTSIYTNIPATADLGAGFFYIIPNGQTRATQLFSGFTVQAGSSAPATSVFVANTTWVTTTDRSGTYPIPADSPFPRGKVTSIPDASHIQVDWLQADGTFSSILTPNTAVSALGGLATSTLSALGLLP